MTDSPARMTKQQDTTRAELEKKIREICTYRPKRDGGTGGYLLTEKQFQQIFALIRTAPCTNQKKTH